MPRTPPTIDDPRGYEYTPAPDDVQTTMRRRFEDNGLTAIDRTAPNVYLHGAGNWWDGPYAVTDNGDGSYTYRSPYTGNTDRFDAAGYWDRNGQHHPWIEGL